MVGPRCNIMPYHSFPQKHEGKKTQKNQTTKQPKLQHLAVLPEQNSYAKLSLSIAILIAQKPLRCKNRAE